MNKPDSTFVPIGTVMDALLLKIRAQMDARIEAEAAAKSNSVPSVNSGVITRLRGAA